MYYFAYGSNLNRKQMSERCPDSKPMFVAKLPNYKLVFTGYSRQWGGGVATIKSARGEKVLGGIYEVSERDLKRLDSYEGCPNTYQRLNVTVFNEDGSPSKAVTYVRVKDLEEEKPSKEYLTAIQQGYRDWGIVYVAHFSEYPRTRAKNRSCAFWRGFGQ